MENNKRVCDAARVWVRRNMPPRAGARRRPLHLRYRLVNKLGRLIRDRGRSTHQYVRAVTGLPHRQRQRPAAARRAAAAAGSARRPRRGRISKWRRARTADFMRLL